MSKRSEFDAIIGKITRIVNDVHDFKEMFEKIFVEINSFASRTFKIYWNYSELNVVKYTLEDSIKWIKEKLPSDGKEYNAALFKDYNAEEDIVIIHHFYVLDNRPCLDGTLPHLVVFTKEPSDELIKQFGEKQLIIFK